MARNALAKSNLRQAKIALGTFCTLVGAPLAPPDSCCADVSHLARAARVATRKYRRFLQLLADVWAAAAPCGP
eukprot:3320307-Alexandrium_andersonii.AAC.1